MIFMTADEKKLAKSLKKAEKLGVFEDMKKIHESLHKKSK